MWPSSVLINALAIAFHGIILCHGSITHQIQRSSCHRFASFEPVEMDKKLVGGLLASLNVPSLMFCANKCTSSQNCQTFNFKPQDLSATASEQINCQLLSMTKESSGATLTASTGWIHYEPAVQESPRCRSIQCPAGFKCVESCTQQSGYECVDLNKCKSQPCLNGATCTDGFNKFTCTCAAGYTGSRCETDIDECASNPCLNNGTCINGVNNYTCICASGYGGIQCQSLYTGGAEQWLSGNGTGGTESNIGTYATKEACILECSKRSKGGVYANGATYSNSSRSCSCEFGMTGRSGTGCVSSYIFPSCTFYMSLTEANRNVNAPTPLSPYCDKDMIFGTYRISGSAGVKIPTYCVNSTSCSTTGAGWIEPPEPTQADGVVTRKVCFSYVGQCCYDNHIINVRVRNCGSYFVYELKSTVDCDYRYCGTH